MTMKSDERVRMNHYGEPALPMDNINVVPGSFIPYSQLPKDHDDINHPSHYNIGRVEVIDAIESWHLGYHLGNVVKYVARAAYKGNRLKDLKKAAWYLNREIARMEPK